MKRPPKKLAKWKSYHNQTICYHLGMIHELSKGKRGVDKRILDKMIHHLRIAVIHAKSLSARVQQHKLLGIR